MVLHLVLEVVLLCHLVRKSVLNIHWKDWCWSWNSNTLATSCEELIHWKRPWCWKRLKAGGEGGNRGWDGWMASSLTWWAWVWVISGSWWWTGRPGVHQFMGLQRVGHDWATELNWAESIWPNSIPVHNENYQHTMNRQEMLKSQFQRVYEKKNLQVTSYCLVLKD